MKCRRRKWRIPVGASHCYVTGIYDQHF